jgi:hypothetical protein
MIRDLLIRAIAYRMQERVHGGLAPATKRRLQGLVAEIEAKGTEAFHPGIVLKPGARLVREWAGQMHTVVVLENGFDYDGERYPSLSKIATRITGAHWSAATPFFLRGSGYREGSTAHRARPPVVSQFKCNRLNSEDLP